MADDELPPARPPKPDGELIRPDGWRALGLPVPRSAPEVLKITHGLLRNDG